VKGPAAGDLHQLRWWLTAIFTVMNTIGLVVFAPLIITLDSDRGIDSIDGRIAVVTASVLRLVRDDSGAIGLDRVSDDAELNDACPQFAVLPGGATPFRAYTSRHSCVAVDSGELDRLATKAVSSGESLVAEGRSVSGGRVRIGVEPFRDSGGRFAGAVVAWSDAQGESDRHQRLVLVVLAGCFFLVTAAALGGYWLSGRAIRPAMAALEQQEALLADTAHDLRNPVAALRALAETAEQDPQQRTDLLPRTVRLASRMGDTIDGLLVRARLAAGVEQLRMEPVWLDQLVGGLVDDLSPGSARISMVMAPTKVRADPTLLRRAIGNLLENAVRHGRGPDGEAVVTVTVANGRVTVADRGPGVSPDLGDKIFDRYRSGSGSSGLGLSIVRWVALSHGGELAVYNAAEGGAIFEFQLPVWVDR
jgi:signal transduction histidine kinase